MSYDKPWQSYQDQLGQLVGRGLAVTDADKALYYLQKIGYYRLSGYWHPFRERSGFFCPLPPLNGKKFKRGRVETTVLNDFKVGASFKNAVDLYVFDKKLRLLVLDAIERIEIALRVDISHSLGKKDPFAYLKPKLLFEGFANKLNENSGVTDHHKWITKHASLISRSKEEFIKHHKTKYGLPLPIWVVCEIWDFGTLSTLFQGMKKNDQNEIANKYGISDGAVLASWLRSLNYLRNVCAHHSRLWNRNIADQPKLPKKGEVDWVDPFINNGHGLARPFLLLCISKYLLTTINPSSTWGERLKQLLLDFPDLQHLEINLRGLGVVDNWESLDW